MSDSWRLEQFSAERHVYPRQDVISLAQNSSLLFPCRNTHRGASAVLLLLVSCNPHSQTQICTLKPHVREWVDTELILRLPDSLRKR